MRPNWGAPLHYYVSANPQKTPRQSESNKKHNSRANPTKNSTTGDSNKKHHSKANPTKKTPQQSESKEKAPRQSEFNRKHHSRAISGFQVFKFSSCDVKFSSCQVVKSSSLRFFKCSTFQVFKFPSLSQTDDQPEPGTQASISQEIGC